MLTVTGVRRICSRGGTHGGRGRYGSIEISEGNINSIYDVLLILLSLIEIQFNPLFHLSSSLGLVGENTERERKSASITPSSPMHLMKALCPLVEVVVADAMRCL